MLVVFDGQISESRYCSGSELEQAKSYHLKTAKVRQRRVADDRRMEEADQARMEMADQMQGGPSAIPYDPHALQDYQMQMMLLEEQNTKRFMRALEERDSTDEPGLQLISSMGVPSWPGSALEEVAMPGGSAAVPSESEKQ
jgi:hypothetical protein